MKGLFFERFSLQLRDLEIPKPAIGEALIKVKLAGICNTDLEIINGYGNFEGILGHEFVGEVVDVNSQDKSLIGKRVVSEINIGCGGKECSFCNIGLEKHCFKRKALGIKGKNGAFCEFLTLPIKNLHVISDKINDEIAVLTEPLAACFDIFNKINIGEFKKIAVLGDGKLGLLLNKILMYKSVKFTHIGKHIEKLKYCKGKNVKTELVGNIEKQKYDLIIDVTGSSKGLEFALNHTTPQGTIVMKSTISNKFNLNLTPLVVNELKIIGSRCGHFKPAIKALENGLDVSYLIEKIFEIKDYEKAFSQANSENSLKILLKV